MAQLISVRLSRSEGQPWGFRLQGGKDFGTQLVLQKVNVGSIADKAGLIAGDAVIRVNNEEVFNMRHKDAQDAILRAGNDFEITVTRGGSTWRPSVTPLTSPVPNPSGVPLLTKTSLAATGRTPTPNIGSGHNTAAKPFGANQPIKSITNKQYNSPVAMYSDETIAETLTAQAEVLAGGAIGVNFKKNEKQFNPDKSDVLRALQESDNEPEPEPHPEVYSAPHHVPAPAAAPAPAAFAAPSGTRHVTAPVNVPKPAPSNGLPPGQNICADCERLIVGMFVRIKDKNLHVECFKCSTCGTSLKNQGYYNLNNKLYCDIHARLAALNSPPPNTNGMVPVTVPPKTSANTISSALSSHVDNMSLNGSSFAAPAAPAPLAASNLPSANGPRPFSYSAPAPTAVSAPKSPIAYPPPAAPTWSAPESAAPAAANPAAAPGKFNIFKPTAGFGAPGKGGIPGKPYSVSGVTQPKRGRGVLNQPVAPGGRVPLCGCCSMQVRGPFITALGRIWCPEHFICVNADCKRPLADIGFVEEKGDLYCEYCFEQYLAPTCKKCNRKVKGDCLNAIGKQYHPECFTCSYCGKQFGNTPFFLEEGEPYCDSDWNELFTTKCFACGFPVEAGDRWVEALNNNYHSQCFNCTMCKKNLEGQSFYAKAGRPFCKNHAR